MRRLNQLLFASLAVFALAPAAIPAHAQSSANADQKTVKKSDTPAQQRQELLKMAKQSVEQLRQNNDLAAKLWDQAYGYAVFDTTKGGLIVTGVGGTGVAVPKNGGGNNAVFMRVGGAGVGLSAGLSNFKLVLLIQDKETFDKFVNGKWDAGLSSQAVAGTAGKGATTSFTAGVRAFRIEGGGLMATADVSAMHFWRYDQLNSTKVG
ncbi:MAG TPA: lipid-binding SYLF domain-containing protein [Gammaproteobacteria bacterium]|nr:lipid-binding SYLF domain-containing protein [Gammaproteobacteria bacterium]